MVGVLAVVGVASVVKAALAAAAAAAAIETAAAAEAPLREWSRAKAACFAMWSAKITSGSSEGESESALGSALSACCCMWYGGTNASTLGATTRLHLAGQVGQWTVPGIGTRRDTGS